MPAPELPFLRVFDGGSAPAVARATPSTHPAQLFEESNGAAELDETARTPAPHPTRGKTLAAEVYRDREVRALLSACSKRAITGVRNKALLALMWRTGIRISEALDLLPHDVDFEQGTVRVRIGKGLKSRTTVVNDTDCLPLLQDWLERRRSLDGIDGQAPLFCTLQSGHVDTSYIRHLMPRLARRAGITQRAHAHALRHTHAADLAIAGVPVPAIQRQLGHASLATTSDYLKRVGVRLDMGPSRSPRHLPQSEHRRTGPHQPELPLVDAMSPRAIRRARQRTATKDRAWLEMREQPDGSTLFVPGPALRRIMRRRGLGPSMGETMLLSSFASAAVSTTRRTPIWRARPSASCQAYRRRSGTTSIGSSQTSTPKTSTNSTRSPSRSSTRAVRWAPCLRHLADKRDGLPTAAPPFSLSHQRPAPDKEQPPNPQNGGGHSSPETGDNDTRREVFA